MNGPALYIDGQWQMGQGNLLTSLNPATNQIVWQADAADSNQVDAAVMAARRAAPGWAAEGFCERLAIIQAYQQLLRQHGEILAETIGQETGKPLWESQTEVAAMINKVDISLKSYHERSGHHSSQAGAVTSVLRHRPHGVLAVFGPYNFPGHLPNGHIVPALLAGNTLVLKPSHLTPRVGEQIVELWHEAGLPAGVLNLVQGDGRAIGQALAGHSQIDGLLFTGSAHVGFQLHRQFADQPQKMLALEMGGNNPLIIDRVDDMKAAVHDTLLSGYLSAGQRCTCARRLLVPRTDWGDAYLDRLATAVSNIRVGRYDDEPQPFMGSLISAETAIELLQVQTQLQQSGGRSLVEMAALEAGTGLLGPGLIDVTAVAELPDKEHFGPLVQVIRYEDFEQALKLANNTRYGLSAGLYSDDGDRYALFLNQIRAGIVNWNRPITGAASTAPFGGIKASGNLRPSAYYAADYCAYPVASMEAESPFVPDTLSPGLVI